jgi:hypothetical protein
MCKKTNPGFLSLISIFFIVAVTSICPAGDIIHVREGCTGGGTSWGDAYGNLQEALDAALPGDEIRVADGTYYPNSSGLGDPREATFQLKNGVTIKGGYAGYGASDSNERNTELYESVLSGDIGVTDDPNDNCYHVVIGSGTDATAVLDGFTITAGNAEDDSWPEPGPLCNGGGMYNFQYSSPTVKDCIFTGNWARYGGGMYNEYLSNPTVTGCTFTGNSGSWIGGGMVNLGSSPTVISCTFSGNSGGGMTNFDYSSPTVKDCIFTGNWARYGGGMYNGFLSSPIVINSSFIGNSAGRHGGGMYNQLLYNLTVISCIFSGNSADLDGGGIYNDYVSSTITSCTFTANSAGRYGGAMCSVDTSDTIANNCIIWGNTASDNGNEFAVIDSSTIEVDYCDVQGGPAGIYDNGSGTINWGSGNIDVEPEFVNADGADNTIGTEDDNLRLQAGSGCIDVGDTHGVNTVSDIDGQPRIMDGDGNGEATVDIGAYEYYGDAYEPVVIYVDADAAGANTGSSWADAYVVLQDALDSAIYGDKIWAAEGTYYPTSDYGLGIGDRGRHFRMKNGVAIHGGFPSGEGTFENRDPQQYKTILSGDLNNDDNGGGDNSDNCYHIFYHPYGNNLDASAILDGFTITAGNADGRGSSSCGGGMSNERSNPTVISCTFTGNSSGFWGGGMCNEFSSPTVTGCTFSGNSTDRDGGGMWNSGSSSPRVISCIFSDNSADQDGGGMCNNWGSPTVISCTFSSNLAGADGAGMYNEWSSPTVTGCTFAGNTARNGNGIACDSREQVAPSYIEMSNCVLWDGGGEIWNNDGSTITISYSDVQGGWPGLGNIDVDPLFVDSAVGDYHLLSDSLCIDTGDPDYVAEDGERDIDGNERIIGGRIDMGAYEYQPPNNASVADAGADKTVYAWIDGIAEVELDGSGSYDEDDDELSYLWTWEIGGEAFDANGVNPVIELGVGEHEITLVVNDGLEDSEPNDVVVTVVGPVEVDVRVMPRVLNRKNRGRYVLAVMRLGDGIGGDDLDDSYGFVLWPGGIDATFWRVHGKGRHGRGRKEKVFVMFDRARLIDALEGASTGKGKGRARGVEVSVVGRLVSGEYIYGADVIRKAKAGKGPKSKPKPKPKPKPKSKGRRGRDGSSDSER